MKTEELSLKIEEVFPFVEKPKGINISFHKDECPHCIYLRGDLEQYTGKELPPAGILEIHQEMSSLSAEGWRWALPSYLRFCLTEEALHNEMETEFLIYNLSPGKKYQDETLERLTALTSEQIKCLILFLGWCKSHEHWGEYCPDEIDSGLKFLSSIRT